MKNIGLILKTKYKLAIGEVMIGKLMKKISKAYKAKIKVSGRHYLTGKKKTIEVPICEFWK